MRLNIKHIFMGIAWVSLTLAACDKNEQINPDEPVIKDGKILLTAGYNPPVSDSKYTFNVFYNVCFFDANDSVFINGIPYTVFPYSNGGDDETENSSSWAHIWVDTNSTGIYKGLFPSNAFTSNISNYEQPTVRIPRRVKGIDYNDYTIESAVRINAPSDGRVIPTTAYTTADAIHDSLIFRNTIAMLALKLRYHPNFARAIDPNASQAAGWPMIIFDSVRIITPNHPMSGSGYIHNPYTQTPNNQQPLLILNPGGNDTISFYFDEAVGMGPKPGNASNPVTVSEQSIGFMPIIAMDNTPATIEIFFTARFNNGVGGPVKKYVYRKSNVLYSTRNMITTIFLHFLKSSDFTDYCTEIQ